MHFYTFENDVIVPKHFVPMAKDPSRTRPSRTTDAKKAAKELSQIWFPSVTTILDVLDKAALVNWKIDQYLETVYGYIAAEWNQNPIYTDRLVRSIDQLMTGGNSDYFLKYIKSETEIRLEAAPKAGSDFHEIIEHNLFAEKPTCTGAENIIMERIRDALRTHCGEQDWKQEQYFINAEKGFAGCADLVSDRWVIDFKTKQEAAKFKPKKMVFDDHSRQLAAYGVSLCDKKAEFRAANIFICLENGEIDFHEHTPDQIADGYSDFKCALDIFHRRKYNPFMAGA